MCKPEYVHHITGASFGMMNGRVQITWCSRCGMLEWIDMDDARCARHGRSPARFFVPDASLKEGQPGRVLLEKPSCIQGVEEER